MNYGANELEYAKPVADALVRDPDFRRWFVDQTRFADCAGDVRLLSEEMLGARSKGAQYWWRSHFSEKCKSSGCRGHETDLLAIFEDAAGWRFAIHVEVKHPGDRFKPEGTQAAAYPIRARCWATNAPQRVLPHSDATTLLLCSSSRLGDYEPYLGHFGSVVTFEAIAEHFPGLFDHPEEKALSEREISAGSLVEIFDPANGLPPIPEWQVELNKRMIDHHCKTEAQRAAALRALEARDRQAFETIVYAHIART